MQRDHCVASVERSGRETTHVPVARRHPGPGGRTHVLVLCHPGDPQNLRTCIEYQNGCPVNQDKPDCLCKSVATHEGNPAAPVGRPALLVSAPGLGGVGSLRDGARGLRAQMGAATRSRAEQLAWRRPDVFAGGGEPVLAGARPARSRAWWRARRRARRYTPGPEVPKSRYVLSREQSGVVRGREQRDVERRERGRLRGVGVRRGPPGPVPAQETRRMWHSTREVLASSITTASGKTRRRWSLGTSSSPTRESSSRRHDRGSRTATCPGPCPRARPQPLRGRRPRPGLARARKSTGCSRAVRVALVHRARWE